MMLHMRDRENFEKGAINTHIMYYMRGKATLDEIMKDTGLSEAEIEAMAKEMKSSQES